MGRYRKKPVAIEAYQYVGGGVLPVGMPRWLLEAVSSGEVFFNDDRELCIKTLEGIMIVTDGAWIIQGVRGELYPCKPDIFEATYERLVG